MKGYKYIVKVPEKVEQPNSDFYMDLYLLERDSNKRKDRKPVKIIHSMEELIDLFEKELHLF